MKKVSLYVAIASIIFCINACNKENAQDDSIQETFESGTFESDKFSVEKFASNLAETVTSVYFIDGKNGFATTYNGNILKTIDGGLTWNSHSITDLPINAISFIDDKIGFAVGGKASCGGTGCTVPGSIVFRTEDFGKNWSKLNIPYEWSELNSVSFINENIGFAIGLGLHIKTIDGGKTWEKFEFDYKGLMKKITFITSQTGICAGLFGNIFRTSNQGENWIKSDNESDGHIYDFCFVNEEVGYACGQKEIVKTIDGGKTWRILKNSPSEIRFIHFSDFKNGIAIGYGHYTGGDFGTMTKAIYWTNDGGLTWKIEDNIEFDYVSSFFNKNIGYSVVYGKTYKITIK
jgi:photosystem II stability/assembly factor-like uncharacterized protein